MAEHSSSKDRNPGLQCAGLRTRVSLHVGMMLVWVKSEKRKTYPYGDSSDQHGVIEIPTASCRAAESFDASELWRMVFSTRKELETVSSGNMHSGQVTLGQNML